MLNEQIKRLRYRLYLYGSYQQEYKKKQRELHENPSADREQYLLYLRECMMNTHMEEALMLLDEQERSLIDQRFIRNYTFEKMSMVYTMKEGIRRDKSQIYDDVEKALKHLLSILAKMENPTRWS